MSFDIFLQCYRNGEPATFKRSVFNEIFGVETDPRDPKYDVLKYPDGSGGAVYLSDPDIEHMMFNHCGGDIFWTKVYELLYVTQSVMFWPDDRGNNSVVANTEALKHLPSTWVEDFGEVHIAHNGRELEAVIFA